MKAMSIIVLALVAAAATSGTSAHRHLLQLPTLTTGTSVPAPAPSPAASASCALQYLLNSGNYNTLVELVEAASEGDTIAQILDSAASDITLLAPTDAGITKTLQQLQLSLQSLLSQPDLITQILEYHILPSRIAVRDLVDGYSFNTDLSSNGVAQSVLVQGSGLSATLAGAKSSATISGSIASACTINIVPLDGLLVPNSN